MLFMTTPIALTPEEKDHLAKWLSRRAIIGGGTFIGLAVVPLIIMFVVSLLSSNNVTFEIEEIVGILTLPVGMIGIGMWLINRRRAIRRWFDEPLEAGNGRILKMVTHTDSGSSLTLEIFNEFGERIEATMGYIGNPDWKVGDEIELIMWKNGRFCPRNFDHMVDVSYLPTPASIQRNKILGTIGLIVLILLLGMGVVFGILGQG